MRAIDKLYEWLARGPAPDCDRILSAALEHAEPAYFDRIAGILLKRGNPSAWAGLVASFRDLPDDLRERLCADPDLLQAAIAEAMKLPSAKCRANTLTALAENPEPRLSYLLPDVLRDPDKEVRAAAGRLLRTIADRFLTRAASQGATPGERAALDADRDQIVRALGESLRTFELHHRLETLEACLWFARDLGEQLWEALTSPRGTCGHVVAEHLEAWNNPRLAGFLVQALPRLTWRRHGRKLLESWSSLPELRAVLANSDLLDDPQIRRNLRVIKDPRWVDSAGLMLNRLPPQLRPHMPAWVAGVGLNVRLKVGYLARWAGSGEAEVQRAATHALASLNVPEATLALERIASARSAVQTYARWEVSARRAGLVPPAREVPPSTAARNDPDARDDDGDEAPEPAREPEFDKLWTLCRNTPPRECAGLIQLIREHLEIWRERLVEKFHGSDPRDRLLGLQILNTPELARRYSAEIERLCRDDLEAIRQVATNVLKPLTSENPGKIEPPSPEPNAPPAEPPPAAVGALDVEKLASSRRALNHLLEEIAAERVSARELSMLVDELRPLLRQIIGSGAQVDIGAQASTPADAPTGSGGS